MGRLLAIGDVHGQADCLQSLLMHAGIAPGDTVVTLGDYIDRGPDSRGVLECLIALSRRVDLIPLLGNHEQMLIEGVGNLDMLHQWRRCGGEATLRSYGTASIHVFPESHWAFLRSLRRHHETTGHFFVHAGADPSLPLPDQSDSDLLWQHLRGEVRHMSGKTMVCGHTPQTSGYPLDLGKTICIDTDVVETGWLTCLEPRTRRYWQSHISGRQRSGFLQPECGDEDGDDW